MKVTPINITELKPNQIFVFGSNAASIHGAGAARLALKWGAKIGKTGLQGQTYGIDTKDDKIQTLPLNDIQDNINNFLAFARKNPQLEFLVTAIGTGLAGYSVKEIAPLFLNQAIPDNVALPAAFWQYDSLN